MKQRIVRRLVGALLACAAVPTAVAAPLAPTVHAELHALMSRLATSGCEFSRNGHWHSGSDAKAHLLRKLEHMSGHGAVQTTEQFIEHAAASSSMSGQPYWVRCPSAAAIPSKTWLSAQLQLIRAPARPASAP